MTANEASTLLHEHVVQLHAARAERDELRAWVRAALRTLVDRTRELDRLREQLRRECQQHAALRETMLARAEAA
jgi:hypothetical protein